MFYTPEGRGRAWSTPTPRQQISCGIPVADALAETVDRLSMTQIVVVTARGLVGAGKAAEVIRHVLGPTFQSAFTGIRAHAPREDVARLVSELSSADGILAIGGGSVCDAVKVARLCLANGITNAGDMDFLLTHPFKTGRYKTGEKPFLPFISIPTTLSAAEFTSIAGIQDQRGPAKHIFEHPDLAPDVVVLDPEMTRATPARLWFSTGIRALDHAVETWCSGATTAFSDACSFYATVTLVEGLQQVFSAPSDMTARLACLEGAWLAIQGTVAGIKSGASHCIGRALGGVAGVPHGETSCVMLPHVLRYNAVTNGEKQHRLASFVDGSGRDLSDVVAHLVQRLQVPNKLRDCGVTCAQLPAVAEAALRDPLLRANPRPIETADEVLDLLKQAW